MTEERILKCHCGSVQVTVQFDNGLENIRRCDCSLCKRRGAVMAMVPITHLKENIMRYKMILVTPIFILLAHYLAVFPHEFAHSFMAYFLGFKSSPFDITYGGTSWRNVLLLSNIDEHVNYQFIFSSGHPVDVSLVAFAGPGIANGSLFLISYCLLKNKIVKKRSMLFYFVFLFNLMNLGNLFDYVPIRTFTKIDDVHNFVAGLNISPWWVFIIGGYIVAFLIYQFFSKTLVSSYNNLHLTSTTSKASLMILCVLILFGFFGGFPYIYFLGSNIVGSVTYLLSATSFLAIPGLIVALWPTKT